MDTLTLLAHPVRLRIVHALRGERLLSTGELCALLPDVSKAMVYRHVDLLAAGGILEVAQEHRIRGAVERRYRLRPDRAIVDAESFGSLSADEHRRGFATALAVLAAEFGAYLDHDETDPLADLVGYRQHALWLTRDELIELITELQRVILPRLANQPAPARTRYLLSPILFPVPEPPTGPGREAPGDAPGPGALRLPRYPAPHRRRLGGGRVGVRPPLGDRDHAGVKEVQAVEEPGGLRLVPDYRLLD